MEEKRIITNTEFVKLKKESERIVSSVMLNIGDFIKNKREEKKLSIRGLNALSRVSTAVISDIENGVSFPRMEILVRLALAMDIPPNELFANFVLQNYSIIPAKQQALTLSGMLQTEGLTKMEVREVLDFIAFKKSRR